MKKTKVLFITNYAKLYGANRSLLGILEGIGYAIEPIILITEKGELTDILEDRQIEYIVLPYKNWMSKNRLKAPLRLIANLIFLPIIIFYSLKKNIDVIYTNNSITPIGIWTSYLLNLPHIWHVREFGYKDYELKYDFGRKFFEFWMNKSDKIIAVSESIRNEVLHNVSNDVDVIYNGVINKEDIKKEIYPESGKKILGIIGLIKESKGQEDAIKAFSRLDKSKDFELWIAGTGNHDYVNYLKRMVIDLNIKDKVYFKGFVKNPFEFYEKVNVILVCSKNEGMGRVTAEAMAFGKVIIGLNNAGTSELIDHNENGLLYNGSIKDLVEKINYATNNNVLKLRKNARNKAQKYFINEKYSKRVLELINNVASIEK